MPSSEVPSTGGHLRRQSTNSLPDAQPLPPAPGPLSGPSDTTWRRQRLLRIGSTDRTQTMDDATTLRTDMRHMTSYGTLSNAKTTGSRSRSKLNVRRGFTLPGLSIPRGLSSSTPHTPVDSPASSPFRSRFSTQRPISAYDRPLVKGVESNGVPDAAEAAMNINGVRVWYSSFTSIDWLHDSIKDAARQARLRKRKSKRGKLQRELDRSIGWIVVSIVGFLTAIVAFMIIRSEQLLFDLKTGYCSDGWLRARRFCCPVNDQSSPSLLPFLSMKQDEEFCPSWRLWADVFAPVVGRMDWIQEQMVEWAAYTALAVRLSFAFHIYARN